MSERFSKGHEIKLYIHVKSGSLIIPGFRQALAAYGGGTCTIPQAGSPGATTVCTGTANGFCLIDTFTTAGAPQLTSAVAAGRCVCYYGYSGTSCGTVDPSATSSTSASSSNAVNTIATLGLLGAGAWALSQGLGSGGSQNALGIGSGSAQSAEEALYLRQAMSK
ncbi:uncharacterized protein LOC134238496 [Saccostrea cucullata]|uniref:uncharacterized protein LOC134238496 n=1 Tax=Saccostrea cuccullata TaxID=36930 RepID=UPI002ED1EB9B